MSPWYVLYIRPAPAEDGTQAPLPTFPDVGSQVVNFLGRDPEREADDKKNPLWPVIQDGIRPAWAADVLRLGYALVFKREGLVKLLLKLKVSSEAKQLGRKRALTFDDVWVVEAQPKYQPFYHPPASTTNTEHWWNETQSAPPVWSPFVAPGGVTVTVGAQRLSDVVRQIFSTPEGYPRMNPPTGFTEEETTFLKPLVPINPAAPSSTSVSDTTTIRRDHMAGTPLYRFGR